MEENTQSIDLRERMEIYIPVEAEVKRIPLWSLPKGVSRRMGLPLSVSGSKELKDCPECIWISPALIRRKGQKQIIQTENEVKQNMVSLLGRKTQSGSGSLRMSFVSSNRPAYRVLKDTMPGKTVAAHASYASQLCQGSSPQTCQDAVVIYNGQIYLSIRKPNRSQAQRDAREPQPAPQSCTSSTSNSSSKSQKKDLLNNKRPKKKRKAKRSKKKNGVKQTVRDGSSSVTAHSAQQFTVSVRREDDQEETRAQQAAEEAAVLESGWLKPQEELMSNGECEMQYLGSEEAGSYHHISDVDSWTRREPLGAACGSTSLQNEHDFEELNDEEEVAKMRAKLRENEAALSSLNSSR